MDIGDEHDRHGSEQDEHHVSRWTKPLQQERQPFARIRDTSRVPVAVLNDVHELHESGWKQAQNEHRGQTDVEARKAQRNGGEILGQTSSVTVSRTMNAIRPTLNIPNTSIMAV